MLLKWPQWSGHSRRSAVESLVLLTPLMVRRSAPEAPAELVDWLRSTGYRPGALQADPESVWLQRWSVPLEEIDAALLETVLRRASTKADGTASVASVGRRRRNTVGAVLSSATRRGLLSVSPMDQVEHRPQPSSRALDVSTVPSPADLTAIVEHVAAEASDRARYAALFATVGFAGMRPSEAIGLRRRRARGAARAGTGGQASTRRQFGRAPAR